jgi:cell division transport system permease protein
MSQRQAVFYHLRRFPYQSLAATAMMYVTFLLISIFALFILGAHSLLNYFESRPQVTAFFTNDATKEQADSLEVKLRDNLSVTSTRYIDSEEALSIYRAQNADNPLLLEMVTADILPASLEVSTLNVTELEYAAQIMQESPGVESVVFQKDIIDTLKKWVTGIRLTGIGLISLLSIVSLTTIVVILGLKFTAQKSEIKTLRLLGATNWYIRSPFMKEGIFYGLMGSVLGWGSSYLVLLYLTPNLLTFLQGINLLPVPIWIMLALLGIELLIGTSIGIVASLVATRRFVR